MNPGNLARRLLSPPAIIGKVPPRRRSASAGSGRVSLHARRMRRRLLGDALDEGEISDRWILSYADFITLLLAFFVVMCSISSVNDGK